MPTFHCQQHKAVLKLSKPINYCCVTEWSAVCSEILTKHINTLCWKMVYLLTLWSRVLLEKLTVPQLTKKFPAFCGIWRFITAFTSSRHLSLSWASSIQSMPPHPTFRRSTLILSPHVRWKIVYFFQMLNLVVYKLFTRPQRVKKSCFGNKRSC